MLLVETNGIKYYVQDRLLLDIDQLKVYSGDRIGLVGRNGSGKTSLLKILSKSVTLEEVSITHHAHIELLPQIKKNNTTKSGGEVTQEYIQQTLNSNAALLMVDEPTNNLDTDHVEWVEKKLKEWKGALIIVSHDRAFLDALCSTIWEIKDGELSEYKGSYSDYALQKKIEHEQDQLAYEKYKREKRNLEEAIKLKEEKAQRATKKPKNVSNSEARIMGAKPHYANKQKKLRKTVTAFETRLENLEKVMKPSELPPIRMDILNEGTLKNQVILRAEGMSGMVEERVLWNPKDFYIRGGDKLAVIGPNGSGKTTLIQKIINQETSVTISPSIKIGYFAQNLNILDNDKSILENVQSSSNQKETFIRTVLASMHFFNEDVYKPVKFLSGGERVKVALSKVFLSNANMLVLDEPTNFLDVESLEALETLLRKYEGSIIFVSHDRKFTENVATKILEIRNKEIKIFEGTYGQYKDRKLKEKRDPKKDELLLLNTKISEILSRLSVNPSEDLENEYQELIKEKHRLEK